MSKECPPDERGRELLLFAAVVILAAITASSFAQAARSETQTAIQLYTSTGSGVARIYPNGSVEILQGISSGYSLEILNNKLYVNKGSKIMAYTLDGVNVKNISTPSNVSFLTFVVLPDERVALMDNENDKIYFVNSTGALIATVNIRDYPDDTLQNLDGIVVNNTLIFSEDGDRNVLRIDLTTYEVSVFKNLSAMYSWVGHITYSNGSFYATGPKSIYRFSEVGNITKVAEVAEGNIAGIVVADGYAYVAVNFAGKVYRVNLQDGTSTVLATGLNYPKDLEMIATEVQATGGSTDTALYIAVVIAAAAIIGAAIYYLRRK